jgi:hypothetical protein
VEAEATGAVATEEIVAVTVVATTMVATRDHKVTPMKKVRVE